MATGLRRGAFSLGWTVVRPPSYSTLPFRLLRGRQQQYSTASHEEELPEPSEANAATYCRLAMDLAENAPPSHQWNDNNDLQTQTQTSLSRLRRIVKKHLAYMDDPWKIGRYVEEALAKDRFDEALLLVRMVSKDRQVEVAWNHLISYLMKKQQLKKAFQLFNDMKKRGQLPNVSTYTILFNGCAISEHPKLAVSEAIKHYHVLLNSDRLRANTIHLNCTLNVCYKAGDLESLFLVADSINDSTRAPDSHTYSIILSAIRQDALKQVDGLTPEQKSAIRKKAVDRGKTVWTEIMDKWKKGRLVMDEGLVCVMGRLLLMNPRVEDRPQVLDLLKETLNLPNLAKGLDSDPYSEPPMQGVALCHSGSSTRRTVIGRNTLGLVIAVLTACRLTNVGIKYWNLMVRHYGIVPDRDNWYRMLGMLKKARASYHATDMLDMLPHEYACGKPYHIALQSCVRDNTNLNVVRNADRALDLMLERLPLPDLHALRLYLHVALVTHSGFRAIARAGAEADAKRQYGLQILAALDRLWEPYKRTYFHYFKEMTKPPRRPDVTDEIYNSQREVMALARHMYRAIVKLSDERLLPDEELQELRCRGAKINREIQAFYLKREKLEPKLKSSRPPSGLGPPERGRSSLAPSANHNDDPATGSSEVSPEGSGGGDDDDDRDTVQQQQEWEWVTTQELVDWKRPPVRESRS
ncbi:hypothetical protein XA68_16219 [Ophiocordyceps unilateralis]|uniref:Pentacotripeptide-repeat region of PRORP domain-containing protein n=1 Tax=Ophiocordyceps unilateralis TaxID=268505 RepID=A0A2A9PL71_OPHUN|nr:hypothetical protein XA68_16219 [Ophiocordyceps unilateralis]